MFGLMLRVHFIYYISVIIKSVKFIKKFTIIKPIKLLDFISFGIKHMLY